MPLSVFLSILYYASPLPTFVLTNPALWWRFAYHPSVWGGKTKMAYQGQMVGVWAKVRQDSAQDQAGSRGSASSLVPQFQYCPSWHRLILIFPRSQRECHGQISRALCDYRKMWDNGEMGVFDFEHLKDRARLYSGQTCSPEPLHCIWSLLGENYSARSNYPEQR